MEPAANTNRQTGEKPAVGVEILIKEEVKFMGPLNLTWAMWGWLLIFIGAILYLLGNFIYHELRAPDEEKGFKNLF